MVQSITSKQSGSIGDGARGFLRFFTGRTEEEAAAAEEAASSAEEDEEEEGTAEEDEADEEASATSEAYVVAAVTTISVSSSSLVRSIGSPSVNLLRDEEEIKSTPSSSLLSNSIG